MIPHTKPFLHAVHEQALLGQLRSGGLNEGDAGVSLVRSLRTHFGHLGGVVTATGTHALAVAIKVIARKNGLQRPVVLISVYSCRCVFDAVVLAGGEPLLCDIDDDDLGISAGSAARLCNSRSVDAIIAPHMFGLPSDIDGLAIFGATVIEDCAHAPGALYKTRRVGTLGSVAAYSFEGSKMLPAGEGGAIMVNDVGLQAELQSAKAGTEPLAVHSRLSDLVAVIAQIQCEQYDEIVCQRAVIASAYFSGLAELVERGFVRLPSVYRERQHLFYRFIIRIAPEEVERLMDAAMRAQIMLRRPIASGPLSVAPLHYETAHRVHAESISVPIYPGLRNEDVERVVNFLLEYEWRYAYAPPGV